MKHANQYKKLIANYNKENYKLIESILEKTSPCECIYMWMISDDTIKSQLHFLFKNKFIELKIEMDKYSLFNYITTYSNNKEIIETAGEHFKKLIDMNTKAAIMLNVAE